MTNLESIVDRIERGEIGLEESLAEYERGVSLVKRGREILNQVEQRVENLRVDGETDDNGDAAEDDSSDDRDDDDDEDSDDPDLPI